MTYTDSELRALHEQVLRQDEAALARFFSQQRVRLWRMVQFRLDRRLAGRVDPDDVLQEAYLDAAKRLHHYEGDSTTTLYVWLRMIVKQTLLDVHRRHLAAAMRDAGREVKAAAGYPQATSVSLSAVLVGQLTSPSQAAMRAELHDKLAAAIEQMNPLDQEVLALRHFEELTNREVAEVLGIEVKAASIRYVRALKRLKQLLAEVAESNDEPTTA